MKALNPNTGNFEEVYVKALDSMPVGTEVDFNGQASDIPVGWEEVDDPNEWKSVNNVTARTYIDIPSGAKEVKMITYLNDTQYTVDLLVERLSTTYKYVKLGSSTDYVQYEYNGTEIRCVQAYVSGSSDINNATTYMYYK